MNFAKKCAIALMGLAIPASAYAATATGTLNVSITISATCSVVSVGAISFGTVSAIGANIDQTSTLTVNCSSTTPYNVRMPLSANGGSVASRRMADGGGNFVNYTLYRDAGRTQVWGDTIGTDTVTGTGNAANQSITIYGRVPTQTVPPPGSYTDAITVTVEY